ncbi:MAG TPA: HEPN domain-containing protein [Archangium sp.]|nr:HEPN domain-containing protein [Archangium sp.]
MVEKPRPDQRVIASYLDEVEAELDAVRRLVKPPPNRLAAFHLQQAAEKLIKAVRLHRGLYATKDHNLEILIQELPEEDPWRERLEKFEELSAYATTYRYPSPTKGSRNPGPNPKELLEVAKAIDALLVVARKELLGS